MPQHPPLNQPFVLGYDQKHLSFPILGVLVDPRTSDWNPTLPAIGSQTGLTPEYAAAFPNNAFVGAQEASEQRQLWIYRILPGPTLTGKEMHDQAQGAVVVHTGQSLAMAAADYSPDWKTLFYSDVPQDSVVKERTVITMPDSVFPTLTDYDQDPEMQSLITTTFQVVQASAVSAPSIVQGVITRYKHIDKWRSLKIVETYATPASFSEQKFSGQHFPNLFNAIYADDDCGVFLDQRGAFNAMVEIRIDISFGNFAAVAGLTLIPNTFAMFAFRVSDVLNDAMTLSATGDCTYTLAIPASSPSKSTYTGYGTTKQLVTGECVLWKAGIFRKTELYVKMI